MEKTTPGHHLTSWGGRTIRSRGHPQPPMSREGETIAIPGQVAWIPRKQQHVGTSRTPTSTGTPKRVSPSKPRRADKRRNGPLQNTSPILASTSTYQTRSHYSLDSPVPFWNLPPPTWNLDMPDQPPPKKKAKHRRKSKKTTTDVEHRHTHAAHPLLHPPPPCHPSFPTPYPVPLRTVIFSPFLKLTHGILLLLIAIQI